MKQAGSPAETAITEIETNLLWKVSHLISGSMLQDDVIQTSLQGVVDSTGCDVAILFLRRDGDLELKAMVPPDSSIRMDAAVGHRIGECLCGLAARDGNPIYSIDITRDPRCTFQECKDAGMRSFAAIPMKDTGGVLGVLGLASRTVRDFERQAAFLETLTTVISIGVRNSLQHEEALRHTAALKTEIKERKRAEEAVRHSEAQLRSFVAKDPFGIARSSILQDRFLSANPALVRMLGYDSEEELLALRMTRDVYCQSEERSTFLAHLPHTGDFSGIETHWRKKDKKQIIVRSSGRVIRNPQALGDGIIEGIQEDVTQQRLLEEQLLHAQKMEAVGRLAGGIAHDFNNLMMVITAQTELLLLEDLDGATRQRVENILGVARKAAELTGQLLAFSRKQTTQPIVTSMNRLLNAVLEMLHHLVGENIEVQVALCDNPWLVKTDRSQFEQVIMNLAVNARDAMPDGGVLTLQTANCEIGQGVQSHRPIMPSGKYAVLTVADSGAGISAETQEHIFEPFFSTKVPGKGTGLGLAMVYGIVKDNDGFIWVESQPGRGARFKIYLPRTDALETVENRKNTSKPLRIKKGSTVLLVEDDDNLRNVIAEFLKIGGYTVIVAEGMQTALRVALQRRQEIDLLLTDVVLKDGNGNRLVARLQEEGCAFKVVYMSGYSPKTIVHSRALNRGVFFLQKPFSRALLMETIEEAIASKS
jgi:signal transduction histidine kinase/CheY-like chemotaxis protein